MPDAFGPIAAIVTAYQPVNSQELVALEQMAIRQQAMLRSARFEAGLFSACLNACFDSDGSARFPLHEDVTYGIEVTVAQNRNYMLADGFLRLARQGNGIQLFLRYQAQAERLYPPRGGGIRARQEAAARATERTHFR